MWVLLAIPVVTLVLGLAASQITPAWASRYFAADRRPADPAARRVGPVPRRQASALVALALPCVFWVKPRTYAPRYKSDMRDIGGEIGAAAARRATS